MFSMEANFGEKYRKTYHKFMFIAYKGKFKFVIYAP